MAETYTSNLGLTKPDYDSPADISVINSNMDKIDNAVANAGKVKSVNGKTGDVTIDDVPKLNGKSADQYMLKTDTAPNSAKLGGKAPEYYLQPRNLLDNSDFRNPVNQREAASAAGGYGIDRWSGFYTINSEYIEINQGFTQFIPEKSVVDGRAYTSAVMLHDGTIITGSATLSKSANGWQINKWHNNLFIGVMYDPDIRAYKLYLNTNYGYTFMIDWAALYEGSYTADTLPPYVPKGYAAELAECQRYYQFYGNTSFAISVWGSSTSQASITVFMPTPMRVDKPTVNIPNVSLCIDGSGNSKTVTLGGVINPNVNSTSIRLRINADTSWTKGDVGTLIADVELSADL